MKTSWPLILPLLFFSMTSLAQQKLSIVPKPGKVETQPGDFTIDQKTKIVVANNADDLISLAQEFKRKIGRVTGYGLELTRGQDAKNLLNVIFLSHETENKKLGKEGYELTVDRNSVL